MGHLRFKQALRSPPPNLRRTRPSFLEAIRDANDRAHDVANRRTDRRAGRSVQAAIAAAAPVGDDELDAPGWSTRFLRWVVAGMLLPLCWVTLWTLMSQFSHAALEQGFWQTAEFWHFAIGVMLMIGWFCSALMQNFFLYLYVLGHEVTHALFVYFCFGKVTAFRVSASGGYITTTKTNLLIALSPYFVPIWSVVAVVAYCGLKAVAAFSAEWDKVFYGVMGLTWTFHMVWTLWMIPRDQPDLKENGRVLSLVVILGGNLLVLVALFCVAGRGPVLENFADFAREWLKHATTWLDVAWRTTGAFLQG